MKTVLTAVLVLLLSGCASDRYAVRFDSDPQGANVVCNGVSQGYTPVTSSLNKTNFTQAATCTAKWISGAERTFPTVTIQTMRDYPSGVRVSVTRLSQDGYSQDAQAAQNSYYQQQQLQQQQRIINQNDNNVVPDAGFKVPTYCYKFGNLVTCNN